MRSYFDRGKNGKDVKDFLMSPPENNTLKESVPEK